MLPQSWNLVLPALWLWQQENMTIQWTNSFSWCLVSGSWFWLDFCKTLRCLHELLSHFLTSSEFLNHNQLNLPTDLHLNCETEKHFPRSRWRQQILDAPWQCVNTSCGHVSSSLSNQFQSPPPWGDRDTPASGSPRSIYRQTAGLDFSLSSSFLSEGYSNFKPFFL